MMNLTNSAKNHFLNFFSSFFVEKKNPKQDLIDYCKSEYGKDWRWALKEYISYNEFPKTYQRRNIS
jgi:hypothetical protein